MLAFGTMVKILDMRPATKGKDPVLDAIVLNANLLEKLKLMHAFKQHVKIFTELLFWKVCQFPAYHKLLTSELKYEVISCIVIEDSWDRRRSWKRSRRASTSSPTKCGG